ncbi:MAG: hypothetical protein KF781_01575 [Chitinophagaceae bacterium]|nr:hypothetical protein [Chitinophagaceae bacterium]MCW5905425.1 hypothetical protein [Chitinophagaceae bacterium]
MAENKDNNEKNELVKNTASIIPEEVLKALPVEERGKILSVVQQSMFQGVVRRGNPISEKITSEHISTLYREIR